MDRFASITAFSRVVEAGSFARAAERMGVSVSAVSRQVAELEAHLNVRLLNRTTRRLSLTESGQAFFDRSVQLLADLEEAEMAVTSASVVPRGTLRLTCSATFGSRHLAPAIAAFAARHPQMRFDVELSERFVDLVDEGFDLAVRIGGAGSQNVVARRVGATRVLCCAAPSYLERHGEPREPEELAKHKCLSYEYLPTRNVWTFRDPKGGERSVRIDGSVHSNNGRFLVGLAAEGIGISREPDFISAPDLRAGRLQPILREFESPPLPIYVVYPSRRHLSAKVRAFADFLSERFANEKWGLA
ncbi:MAG TPA: LysR family transcriptional regulator [Casimicrobiaceae bacterium]|nr:LysR family transcriptional regulator [Casimicrobiaceae bacterium]